MQTRLLLLSAAIGLSLAGAANAVHLDPSGRGQVLIYPYYTVNNHQQTLLSVTNTSSAGQALKVRFKEGYNSRDVLDFNVWLAPYDVWTATVFALEDAGLAGEGAAVMTSDRSCTSPQFSASGLTINGTPYRPFVNYAYGGANEDGGPSSSSRMREGFIEIIAMTDVGAPLLSAITHNTTTGVPADCLAVQPNGIMGTPAVSTRPSGGLIGAASIINVGLGTLLATRAEALGGFTGVSLFTGIEHILPNLASVNDVSVSGIATAHLFDDRGRALHLSYGSPGGNPSRPVDAVSAVLMADQIYNEYAISQTLDAGSDWVVTFPTKHFYTDELFVGALARPPFGELFSQNNDGRSNVEFRYAAYDRETRKSPIEYDGWIPPPFFESKMHYVTNVLPFFKARSGPAFAQSEVVGSRLIGNFGSYSPTFDRIPFDAGWMVVDTNFRDQHRLPASNEGKVLRGLPLIGFWASNIVNNQVSNGVLSNYSAAVRHTTSVTCVTGTGTGSVATPCD